MIEKARRWKRRAGEMGRRGGRVLFRGCGVGGRGKK